MARQRKLTPRENAYLQWLMRERNLDWHDALLYARGGQAAIVADRRPRKNREEIAASREANRSDTDRRFDRVQQPCPTRHYKRGNCTLPRGHSGKCQFKQFDIEEAIANADAEKDFEARIGEFDPAAYEPDEGEYTCLMGKPCCNPMDCNNPECWDDGSQNDTAGKAAGAQPGGATQSLPWQRNNG